MQGLSLKFQKNINSLQLRVIPNALSDLVELDLVHNLIADSDYQHLFIDDEAIHKAINYIKANPTENSEVTFKIGETRPHRIDITISKDEMQAEITFVAGYNAKNLRREDFYQALALNGVVRGISFKTIDRLLHQQKSMVSGQTVTFLLAKGLPPKKGKSTRMIPVIDTDLQRVLKPKQNLDGTVDMRNLGEIACITKGTHIADIIEPTIGRSGFTVTNEKLAGTKGDHCLPELGDNTILDPQDPSKILADIDGQAKFVDGCMHMRNSLTLKGVNVASGNVDFKGCVIVDGDVSEHMRIIATGDVIVRGFVDAATIKAGGDIIVKQGCSGPADKHDCVLMAKGTICIGHGQGLSALAGGDFTAERQVSHSLIDAKGDIIIGKGGRADGNLFACKVIARRQVKAGVIGAKSGSRLEIDYTRGLHQLKKRLEKLHQLKAELTSSNADHVIEFAKLNTSANRVKAERKLHELELALEAESELLVWLNKVEGEAEAALEAYKSRIAIIAMKELHPNVLVQLDKTQLVTKSMKTKSALIFSEENWKQVAYKGS